MTERERFEKYLKDDPCDIPTRKVYADWLEENGLDDEAAEQRRMATREWCDSYVWMTELASRAGTHDPGYAAPGCDYDDPPPVTLAHLIEAGNVFVDSGGEGWFTQMGDEWLRDNVRGGLLEQYWRHWRVVTGRDEEPPEGRWTLTPFSCSC